ncbi:MAG: IS5 family transposase, partial [Flavobacteriia bacterium]|nr:IS5 family transposase [Flavobacteriia bacterium]
MEEFIRSLSWEQVYLFLQGQKRLHTGDEKRVRRFFEGVCLVLRSGMQWRFLPAAYGSWRAVHRRCLLHYALSGQADLTDIMIDSTIVRAHACAAGYKRDSGESQALGRSKGGFTPKSHMACETLGGALTFTLTPGQRNDMTQVSELFASTQRAFVIADKAYDSQ